MYPLCRLSSWLPVVLKTPIVIFCEIMDKNVSSLLVHASREPVLDLQNGFFLSLREHGLAHSAPWRGVDSLIRLLNIPL